MAGTLFGSVVNTCDSTTGFSAGGLSGDDDFAEGTGALGAKVSNTYTSFHTTSLTGGPFNFASGGGEFGQHFIMWFSSKSRLDAVSGYRLVVGNGTSRGEWDVPPVTSELKRNGAFVTRVIDLTRDFSRIAAGSWTTTGNPAQLSNVTQMGGGLQTSVSIMGSFNNAQVDQMTIGWGIRLSGGTSGTPDTFETARAADEDAGIWGWSQGRTLKGGIYIGPETGSAASVFSSENERRVFAASPVAAGFYRVEARGAGTDVTLLAVGVEAEDSSVARWNYTVGADTNSWTDTDSVYSGIGTMTLEASATLTGLKVSDFTSITQNGATVSGLNISSGTGASAFIMDDYSTVSDTVFAGNNIAIDATAAIIADAVELDGLKFSGNTTDVTVNSASDITIKNLNGSDALTCTNTGAGGCTIETSVTISLTNIIPGSRVYIRDITNGINLFNEIAATTVFTGVVAYAGDITIRVRVRNASGSPKYKPFETTDSLTDIGFSLSVNQLLDE